MFGCGYLEPKSAMAMDTKITVHNAFTHNICLAMEKGVET